MCINVFTFYFVFTFNMLQTYLFVVRQLIEFLVFAEIFAAPQSLSVFSFTILKVLIYSNRSVYNDGWN